MPGLITGTDQNDHLIGTEFSDQIFALGGDDTVRGLGDDDQIYGGAGDDALFGGAGNDDVYGGDGFDYFFYEGGMDHLYGGADDDYFALTTVQSGLVVDGGAGLTYVDLSLYGLSAPGTKLNVELREQTNNTLSLIVNGETAVVLGEDFVVYISTGGGDDTVVGASTGEYIFVGNGDDSVSSNGGDDVIDLGAGDDHANSGDGDDLIFVNGLTSGDHIDGGLGFDAMHISFYGMSDVSVDLRENADGTILMRVNHQTLDVQGIEQVHSVEFFGGRNSFRGTNQQENVYGGSGDDRIDTAGGDDFISTGFGDDQVNAGSGDDYVYVVGPSQSDTIDGGDGEDTVYLDFSANAGPVAIRVDTSRHNPMAITLDGSRLNITNFEVIEIAGSRGDDSIRGGDGDDRIEGYLGDDILLGYAGADVLSGSLGDDTIAGGAGRDTLSGGEGADDFVFARKGGRDTIVDFEVGVDHIVISAGSRVSSFDDLQISQHGDDVWINMRGTSIVLLGVEANDLSADNFIFG
ncbi:calcium-binding protein [Thioclava sp. FR2]|uniref:calcium-binding protein n=1 Tax=Thioclava sp. FR2 TaxID=3445780 RepID=UPI003EB8945B